MNRRSLGVIACAWVLGAGALAACSDDGALPTPSTSKDGGRDATGSLTDARADTATPLGDAQPDVLEASPDAQADAPPDHDAAIDAGDAAAANDAADATATPDAAGDASASCLPAGPITVTNAGSSAYDVNGVSNAPLTLCRGSTYAFVVAAPGHPFWIKTIQGSGVLNGYADGVTNNGTEAGTIDFVVPATAPSSLFYNCQFHGNMTGTITIVN